MENIWGWAYFIHPFKQHFGYNGMVSHNEKPHEIYCFPTAATLIETKMMTVNSVREIRDIRI
jgi:hypothetical protein